MKYLLSIISLITLLSPSFAEEKATPRTHYQMMFKVNNMACGAKLNGLYLAHTNDLTDDSIPTQVSLTQPISQYLDEGENVLMLEAINAAPYVDNPMQGYCDIKIMAMVKNPETGRVHSKEVTHIRYTYVENKDKNSVYPFILTVENSRKDQDPLLTREIITLQELEPSRDAKNAPIQRALATREITINHSQPFSWIHQSTPFTDTPENRQKLWDKYNEIRTAIIKKDKRAIRKFAEPGVTDVANFQGNGVEDYFNRVFSQLLENDFFNIDKKVWEPEPLSIDDYDLELYAGGKLFRFNEKKKTLFSPLQWYNPFTRNYLAYNPLFTYINGEIVMASF